MSGNNPFAYDPSPPPAQGAGFLGIPATTWKNLQDFGANMSAAANARTPQGFLANPSLGAAFSQGVLSTEQMQQQQAASAAQSGLLQAQQEQTHIGTLMNELQIPKLEALNKYYQSPQFAADMGFQGQDQSQQPQQQEPPPSWGGGGAAGGQQAANTAAAGQGPGTGGGWANPAGTTPNAPGSEGGGPLGDWIGLKESGNNPSALNQQGFAGLYGFGTAAMQSAGMYIPAKGEDLSHNQWAGTINVPGYGNMSLPQFMSNPRAQTAAWNVQQSFLWDQAQKNGAENYVGRNIGGQPVSQSGIVALSHFAGPTGALKILQSGGQYNPADANGTHALDYMNDAQQYVQGVRQGQAAGQAGAQAAQQFDPNVSANPQDVPGPFIPPGGVTPAKAQQQVGVLSQQLKRMALAGLPTAGLQAQIDMYQKMAVAPYSNIELRPGGAAIQGGNVVKMASPTTMVGPGGATVPAAEESGYSVNGVPQSPTTIGSVNTPGGPSIPAPAAAPQAASAPQGQPGQAPRTPADDVFDAALLGKPMPSDPQQTSGQMYSKVPPGVEETMTNGIERIDGMQEQASKDAVSAAQGNATIQRLRDTSQSWTSDKFAEWHNDARTWSMAIGHQLGINDPRLEQQVGDFAAFNKNAQQMVQERVRMVSPRASTQEYQMISKSLPSSEIGNNAIQQISDQIQGTNDFTIARNYALSRWRAAQAQMTPNQQYIQTLGDFDGNLLKRITPYTFMLHAMTQTQGGQAQFQGLVSNLQKTPEGQRELQRIQQQFQYGKQSGMFDAAAGNGQ